MLDINLFRVGEYDSIAGRYLEPLVFKRYAGDPAVSRTRLLRGRNEVGARSLVGETLRATDLRDIFGAIRPRGGSERILSHGMARFSVTALGDGLEAYVSVACPGGPVPCRPFAPACRAPSRGAPFLDQGTETLMFILS